ncbi:MAG: hypothetical protein DRJ96_03050 [Thermoprotei archaeon]|nr:MAG: hypothetical protein DRJ67_03430 [Thermoprotei archaeon]RLE97720.1 MAG: hypothetical protein DRJ96_03050 [Thermoprotei archaeon]
MFTVGVYRDGVKCSFEFPWRVSIVAFMANPKLLQGEEVEETLKALAEDPFFDMLEVNPPEKPEHWRILEKIRDEAGVEIAIGAQPLVLMRGVNPSALDEAKRKSALNALKRVIDEAATRGVSKVALCSGPDPGVAARAKAKEALVASLKELAAHAEGKGVTVILETFDREWDKKQLIGPIREAVEIAKAVREEHGNFGLLWDLSHAPMLEEKPGDLEIAAPYLAHIHIGCTKRLPDGSLKDWHPGFYRPGSINGVEEVEELIKALSHVRYRGALGFEVKPEEGQNWLEVVNAAKGVLYTAFARYASRL